MRRIAKPAIISVTIGLFATLPFLALEWVNNGGFATQGFPAALFLFLWLLASLAAALIYYLKATFKGRPFRVGQLLVGISILLIVAALWTVTVADQMPCFMGVPNCD